MTSLKDTKERVSALLEEIDQLKQSEFPYDHPRKALKLIELMFKECKDSLEEASDETVSISKVQDLCGRILPLLFGYVPLLGFLLRATNVRNAFEMHSPLQRMAEDLLGKDTKLILSSEWEFSPLTYESIPNLKGFVLIGLPAPESSNPLILPLAGHELGHSVWEQYECHINFDFKILNRILDQMTGGKWEVFKDFYPNFTKNSLNSLRNEKITNLFPYPVLASHMWAVGQAKEMFCDFMGLRTFGKSFLHAFAYLTSPGSLIQRSLDYPNMKRRIFHLINCANKMEIDIPTDYKDTFIQENEPADPATALLVSISDTVTASLEQDLIELANKFADDKNLPKKNEEIVKGICESYEKWVTPSKDSASLIDIMNAGWECYLNDDLWKEIPQIKGINDEDFVKNRKRVLRDLLLKSLEITEVYARLEGKY